MKLNHTNQDLPEDTVDVKGRNIAGMLNAQANRLSMRTLKQLENGRDMAIKAHHPQISGVTIHKDGSLGGFFSWADHHRIASTGLVLGAIIAGFMLMQSLNQNNEQGDAFLLGSELPPEAFVDKGFEPSLNIKQAKL